MGLEGILLIGRNRLSCDDIGDHCGHRKSLFHGCSGCYICSDFGILLQQGVPVSATFGGSFAVVLKTGKAYSKHWRPISSRTEIGAGIGEFGITKQLCILVEFVSMSFLLHLSIGVEVHC